MDDALVKKQKEEQRLDAQIIYKTNEVFELIRNANNAKDEALKVIEGMKESVLKAHEAFLQYLHDNGLIYKDGEQLLVKQRQRR